MTKIETRSLLPYGIDQYLSWQSVFLRESSQLFWHWLNFQEKEPKMEIVWIVWQRDRLAGLDSTLCRMMSCCHGSDILLVSVGTVIQILPSWILLQLNLAPLGKKKEEETGIETEREKSSKTARWSSSIVSALAMVWGIFILYTSHWSILEVRSSHVKHPELKEPGIGN